MARYGVSEICRCDNRVDRRRQERLRECWWFLVAHCIFHPRLFWGWQRPVRCRNGLCPATNNYKRILLNLRWCTCNWSLPRGMGEKVKWRADIILCRTRFVTRGSDRWWQWFPWDVRRSSLLVLTSEFAILALPFVSPPTDVQSVGVIYSIQIKEIEARDKYLPKVNPCVQTSTTRCMARDTRHCAKELHCTDKSGTLCWKRILGILRVHAVDLMCSISKL